MSQQFLSIQGAVIGHRGLCRESRGLGCMRPIEREWTDRQVGEGKQDSGQVLDAVAGERPDTSQAKGLLLDLAVASVPSK